MGYILPISHNVYKNYQHRMPKEILGLRNVNKSYKVILEKHTNELMNQDSLQEHGDLKQTYKKVNKHEMYETKLLIGTFDIRI